MDAGLPFGQRNEHVKESLNQFIDLRVESCGRSLGADARGLIAQTMVDNVLVALTSGITIKSRLGGIDAQRREMAAAIAGSGLIELLKLWPDMQRRLGGSQAFPATRALSLAYL
jgi:hypothetical protein